jgi:hypothetical protein
MKSAPGRAGIATSPWPCSPMQCSSSCALRPRRSGKKGDADEEVRLSVAERRRLLPALQDSEEHCAKRLWWSRFRRRHQASAQRGHVARRARQAPRARPPGPPPLRVPSLPGLTPAHWAQISPLLPRSRLGRPASDHRLMVEGSSGSCARAAPGGRCPNGSVLGRLWQDGIIAGVMLGSGNRSVMSCWPRRPVLLHGVILKWHCSTQKVFCKAKR